MKCSARTSSARSPRPRLLRSRHINRPDLAVMLAYVRGVALVQAERNAEAEGVLRGAVALAERGAPEQLALVIQGHGFALAGLGRHDEAADAYRKALDAQIAAGGDVRLEMAFREQLANALNMVGRTAEAEVEMRKAVAFADRVLDDANLDRAVRHGSLAQVLQRAGKTEAARSWKRRSHSSASARSPASAARATARRC